MKRRMMWRVKDAQGVEMVVSALTDSIREHYTDIKRVLVLKASGE